MLCPRVLCTDNAGEELPNDERSTCINLSRRRGFTCVLPATAQDLVLYIKYKLGLINVVGAKFNDSVTIGHRDSEINDPF